VDVDLKIMHGFAQIIEVLFPQAYWLSLPYEIEVFAHMMKKQLDLSQEAVNLKKFKENFNAWSQVSFPSPKIELSSPDILVETWIEGLSVEQFLRLGPTCFDKRIATIGLSSFLVFILLTRKCYCSITMFMQIYTQEIF
jgi:aarF domain-containing kinase